MDKKVLVALNQLTAALAEAADAEGNSVAVMNAYFVMEQEVDSAAGHCARRCTGRSKRRLHPVAEQMSLYPHTPERCCDTCSFYSALKEPRVRSDGAVIYGYCFKAGDTNHSSDMGKGYAVFINGGSCKQFKKGGKVK